MSVYKLNFYLIYQIGTVSEGINFGVADPFKTNNENAIQIGIFQIYFLSGSRLKTSEIKNTFWWHNSNPYRAAMQNRERACAIGDLGAALKKLKQTRRKKHHYPLKLMRFKPKVFTNLPEPNKEMTPV